MNEEDAMETGATAKVAEESVPAEEEEEEDALSSTSTASASDTPPPPPPDSPPPPPPPPPSSTSLKPCKSESVPLSPGEADPLSALDQLYDVLPPPRSTPPPPPPLPGKTRDASSSSSSFVSIPALGSGKSSTVGTISREMSKLAECLICLQVIRTKKYAYCTYAHRSVLVSPL